LIYDYMARFNPELKFQLFKPWWNLQPGLMLIIWFCETLVAFKNRTDRSKANRCYTCLNEIKSQWKLCNHQAPQQFCSNKHCTNQILLFATIAATHFQSIAQCNVSGNVPLATCLTSYSFSTDNLAPNVSTRGFDACYFYQGWQIGLFQANNSILASFFLLGLEKSLAFFILFCVFAVHMNFVKIYWLFWNKALIFACWFHVCFYSLCQVIGCNSGRQSGFMKSSILNSWYTLTNHDWAHHCVRRTSRLASFEQKFVWPLLVDVGYFCNGIWLPAYARTYLP
jgi:hypothetical protein